MKYFSVLSYFFLLLFIFCSVFISLQNLHAQIADTPEQSIPGQIPDIKEEVDIFVTPENPQPNQDVTITLEAPGTNIDKANISWKRNGVVEKSGVGVKEYTFNAGPLGTVSNIVLDFLPYNGPLVEKTVQVTAQSVDILWEANTYRPPFYQSKAMYTTEGNVVFMAMPNLVDTNGKTIDPRTLVYNWSVDYTAHADKSGYGKNYYVFDGDVLGQQTAVEVHVSTVKGDIQGDGSLIITPSGIGVLAYENNPTYGILFNKAMNGDIELTKKEITLSAYPFFVSTQSRNDFNLQYSWSINSSLIPAPQSQNDIIFRNVNNDSGASVVTLSVQNADKIRQGTNYSFNMILNPKSEKPFNF